MPWTQNAMYAPDDMHQEDAMADDPREPPLPMGDPPLPLDNPTTPTTDTTTTDTDDDDDDDQESTE